MRSSTVTVPHGNDRKVFDAVADVRHAFVDDDFAAGVVKHRITE